MKKKPHVGKIVYSVSLKSTEYHGFDETLDGLAASMADAEAQAIAAAKKKFDKSETDGLYVSAARIVCDLDF